MILTMGIISTIIIGKYLLADYQSILPKVITIITNIDTFKQYFEQFGDVDECVLMQDKITNKSRGFGFITFKDVSSLKRVLQITPHIIDGKLVECKAAVPKDRDQSNLNDLTLLSTKLSQVDLTNPTKGISSPNLDSNSLNQDYAANCDAHTSTDKPELFVRFCLDVDTVYFYPE